MFTRGICFYLAFQLVVRGRPVHVVRSAGLPVRVRRDHVHERHVHRGRAPADRKRYHVAIIVPTHCSVNSYKRRQV